MYVLEPYQSTDDQMLQSRQGVNFFANGAIYVQYGDSTAVANSTTATSLFNNTTSTTSNFYNINPYDGSTLTVAGGAHTLGTIWLERLVGVYGTTGTPTLTITSGFKNAASTYTAICTTGAITMPSSVTNMDFEIVAETVIKALTGTNNVIQRLVLNYRSAAATMLSVVIASTAATVDLTQNQTFEVQATWGTASASNTITTKYAYAEVIG